MTTLSKVFFGADFIGASPEELFEASGATLKVEAATAVNVSGADVMLTVYVLSAGQSVSDGQALIKSRRIRPHESYLMPEMQGQTLESGQSVWAQASAANAIVARITGLEVSA